MSNVVSMDKPCDYLVRRAAARRRRGNYDEAMTLLSKAKDQFGLQQEIEIEMARIYDEMECEEEAVRAYLRVVRLGGENRAEALFQLALSAMQRGDFSRSVSYYDMFLSSDQSGVSQEYAQLLGEQLRKETNRSAVRGKRAREKALISRGVEHMHAGRIIAARRSLERALRLRETARIHTLLACCALLEGDAERSISHAGKANAISPWRVQTLLVMADAYALAGDERRAKNCLYLSAVRARDVDDYLATALESAKRGEDRLTLRLTGKLLKMEPFHTRAMLLRGCALLNLNRYRDASRLFGRVCVLMPENTVSESLYRMAREEKKPSERLSLGIEVPHDEGVARAMQLVAALYLTTEDLRSDQDRERMLCRYAAWAFRSQLAGDQVATVALFVMRLLDTPQANAVMEDALTDPQVADEFKCKALQLLSDGQCVKPYPVDMGGRYVRLAAGGSADRSSVGRIGQEIVQQAADALSGYKDSAKALLELWLAYLEAYGAPKRRYASACTAALEYVYHVIGGRRVELSTIAGRRGVSKRLCAFYARRILRVQNKAEVQNP